MIAPISRVVAKAAIILRIQHRAGVLCSISAAPVYFQRQTVIKISSNRSSNHADAAEPIAFIYCDRKLMSGRRFVVPVVHFDKRFRCLEVARHQRQHFAALLEHPSLSGSTLPSSGQTWNVPVNSSCRFTQPRQCCICFRSSCITRSRRFAISVFSSVLIIPPSAKSSFAAAQGPPIGIVFPPARSHRPPIGNACRSRVLYARQL